MVHHPGITVLVINACYNLSCKSKNASLLSNQCTKLFPQIQNCGLLLNLFHRKFALNLNSQLFGEKKIEYAYTHIIRANTVSKKLSANSFATFLAIK